jgi:hypothetical protein
MAREALFVAVVAASGQILTAAETGAGRYENATMLDDAAEVLSIAPSKRTEILRSSAHVHITHSLLQVTGER